MQRGTRGVAALWSQATYFLLRSSQFETFLIFRIYHGQAVWLSRLMMTKMTATTKMITMMTMAILCLWQYNWRGWLPPTATVTPVKVNTSQRRLPSFCFYTTVWFPFLSFKSHLSQLKIKRSTYLKDSCALFAFKAGCNFLRAFCVFVWCALSLSVECNGKWLPTAGLLFFTHHTSFIQIFILLLLQPKISCKLVQRRLWTILHIRWYNRAWRPHDKNSTLFTLFLQSK